MRAALYARVSTTGRGQDPDNQLFHLRNFAEAKSFTVVGEYVDYASALDIKNRKALRDLQGNIRKHKYDVVLIWKLDRMFRNMRHMHSLMGEWEGYNTQLVSMTESIDSTSTNGRLMLNILGSLAEWERDVIRERTQAQRDRRVAQGLPIGPDQIEKDNPELERDLWRVYESLDRGEGNISTFARQLGVNRSTLSRKYKRYREGGN
ncbi:MAG: resolvase [Chloroflexi bacterium]|nr:resolvase [Chloroflexota bacterium]|tara:strand:+ start:6006 stop:6623 length:618 start_codon:yes stop_codon:yes gene_type:complete